MKNHFSTQFSNFKFECNSWYDVWNTFFNFGCSSKFALPPWTVISNFGSSRFHSLVNSWTSNSGRVSYDNRTYCIYFTYVSSSENFISKDKPKKNEKNSIILQSEFYLNCLFHVFSFGIYEWTLKNIYLMNRENKT